MKPFTFIHTADCHLDAPFVGIGGDNPELARRLHESQRTAFDDLIRLCIERNAAFVLIGGDLYDVAERSLTTRVRLRDAFRRLGDRGIELFLATGNHDNLEETQRGLDFPPNVHIFSPEQPQTFLWPDDRPIASITGISYGLRAIEENLALRFPPPPGGMFNIAVLHCRVEGSLAKETYAPCRLDDLLRAGYDYWALGHVHARQVLAEGRTTVVYPGCLQGRQIGENGEKGATIVTVDERGRVGLDFAPLDRIEWIEAEADVSEVESDEELEEALRSRADELAAKVATRVEGIVVRWRLVGRLACDAAARQGVLKTLRESAAFDRHPFLWTESIDASGTIPPFDLNELAVEESPRGDLARLVRRIQNDPAEMELLREGCLDKAGPSEFVRELETTEPIEKILDEAMWLGLNMLSRPKDR